MQNPRVRAEDCRLPTADCRLKTDYDAHRNFQKRCDADADFGDRVGIDDVDDLDRLAVGVGAGRAAR